MNQRLAGGYFDDRDALPSGDKRAGKLKKYMPSSINSKEGFVLMIISIVFHETIFLKEPCSLLAIKKVIGANFDLV